MAAETLRRMYKELDERPIDYRGKLPPRLDRRYIVTGPNGKLAKETTYSW